MKLDLVLLFAFVLVQCCMLGLVIESFPPDQVLGPFLVVGASAVLTGWITAEFIVYLTGEK